MRQFLCLALLLFSASTIPAHGFQAAAPSGMFPFALVWEAADFAASDGGIWQPPWPVELPPDAFRVLYGGVSRITLEGEGVLLAFSYDTEGRVREFPFMLDGSMAQVSLGFRDGEIREMTLNISPDGDSWELEVLESETFYPARAFPTLVRGFIGNTWYFITLSRWDRGITETWFDQEGTVLGGYVFDLTETKESHKIRSIRCLGEDNNLILGYYYDSWGFLTGVSKPGRTYTVLHYRDALPRYWERQSTGGDAGGTGLFYFQWDARGFLVRMVPIGAAESESRPVEYRFEYTLDERGNWIERREIQMFAQAGFLFPSPGTIFRRSLEYR
ncbi:MAG: hypothetical protein FWB99_01525 [Treponema sp.]|nr:hypothetical protein [Treponema sp.]